MRIKYFLKTEGKIKYVMKRVLKLIRFLLELMLCFM